MLMYTSLTSIQVVITAHPLVKIALQDSAVPYAIGYYVLTSYILTGALAFIITGFFIFHIYLLCNNSTTIEYCEKRSESYSTTTRSPYNLNVFKNF